MKIIILICASLLSGALLIVSFPRFDLSFFIWIALVPLLLAMVTAGPRYGFGLSFLCGCIFFTGIFYWIFHISGYLLLHHALLAFYLGFYFAFFGLTFGFILNQCGLLTALFTAPGIWVSLEFIRANMSFLSLPWGLLAHSQYQHPTLLQIVSISGTYGLSFLIVLVNAAVVMIIVSLASSIKGIGPSLSCYLFSNRGRGALVLFTAIVGSLTMLYGLVVISQPLKGQQIKVAVAQGNIGQAIKWDHQYAKCIMQIYADLTRKASEEHPALIIWPETAVPGAINLDYILANEVRRIARRAGAHLLVGSSEQSKFNQERSKDVKFFNSAFFISPDPKRPREQRYDKIHLLPFGEYLPLKGIVPWSFIRVPDIGRSMAGNQLTLFNLPPFKIGTTICWESIFPDLARRLVKNGAHFIVNITNEAWFGKSAAPYQLVAMNVFRAVENRVYVVRCANTGISCLIDPYGRIVDRVRDTKGEDIFVRGILSGWITSGESKTVYTQFGDWFAWLSLIGSTGFLAGVVLRKRYYCIHGRN